MVFPTLSLGTGHYGEPIDKQPLCDFCCHFGVSGSFPVSFESEYVVQATRAAFRSAGHKEYCHGSIYSSRLSATDRAR